MDISPDYPTEEMKSLYKAILTLKTPDEAARFFRDLLTEAEIKEFANRWQMVQMIARGISYLDIAKKLGVSTTTVNRCAKWLHHGMSGYKLVLDRQK
jgi:TrpR-related protein YerC/YecD